MVDLQHLSSERNSMPIKFDRIVLNRKLFSWRLLRPVLLQWQRHRQRLQQVALHYLGLEHLFNFTLP